jgi:hypothetical protein
MLLLLLIGSLIHANALTINEIMSNPIGDDGGREWIELYNTTDSPINISNLTISIKGGNFIPVTPVSGGTVIAPSGYAIIGSTVSGATRFLQDYSSYKGPLLKSSISLVNTGVTSIEIKMQGVSIDVVSSYTAAKEGSTYSFVGGSFVTGIPTPGEENKLATVSNEADATTTPTGSQATLPQMSPPSADIVLYLPSEKTVVAGAPTTYSVYSLTHEGKAISNVSYIWSFGDGGERTGSTTVYRYFYPGRYIAQVEGSNGLVSGTGRMIVRAVTPDILISSILIGKYGAYIDITNPNMYDLDISGWRLSIDDVPFFFPKNTILANGVTHIPGATMGFASTTVSSTTLIKLLFPNLDEVLRVYQRESGDWLVSKKATTTVVSYEKLYSVTKKINKQPSVVPSSQSGSSSLIAFKNTKTKDTRIASFVKSLFGK